MAAAANLTQAAGTSYTNLFNKNTAVGNLQTALLTFAANIGTVFSETMPNDHPCADWLAVIAAFATQQLSATALATLSQINQAAQYVYRLCLLAQQNLNAALITAVQATTGPNSVLVQYNANF